MNWRQAYSAISLLCINPKSSSQSEVPVLYGALSTREIWQFGMLQRGKQHLVEDLTLYRVPQELELLTRILIGIVSRERDRRDRPLKKLLRTMGNDPYLRFDERYWFVCPFSSWDPCAIYCYCCVLFVL